MVNSFVQKMQVAEQQYPGLEQELNQLNYNDPRIHSFIGMVNDMENTGDIMKEVLDNPHKLSQILSDIQDQPYLAQKNLQKLSASIKQNMSAKAEEAQARDPYSQLKPSPTAGMDNGSMSVSDFRKMFKG
jgi:septation ring formation regulator EzrA